jgi:dipeptide/tripeptide permease
MRNIVLTILTLVTGTALVKIGLFVMRHQSSAAFELGMTLIIIGVGGSAFAISLLVPDKKGGKR